MNGEPDFWVPYGGGHLPMIIVSMEVVTEAAEQFGPKQVEMTIRAVSCGAPVYYSAQPTTPPAIGPPGQKVLP